MIMTFFRKNRQGQSIKMKIVNTLTIVVIAIFTYIDFFFQAEDGIRDLYVTGVQTCALPISFEGDVKLTDFGIAKAKGFLIDNEGEVVAGKADYMSPEQANFQITDKRSDLFSSGVVLAHLLLGRNIFKAPSAEESRQRMINLPIPDFRQLDQRVDDRLNQILHRALARDLEKRYPTADEMLYDLEHYIYHSGYGPTNETLGKFIRELFGQAVPSHMMESARGNTVVIEQSDSRGFARSQ